MKKNPDTSVYEKKTINVTHTISNQSVPMISSGITRNLRKSNRQITVNRKMEGSRGYTPIKRIIISNEPQFNRESVKVSQLIPSIDSDESISDTDIALYERGLDEFTAGNWEEAYSILHSLPANDRAKDFLSVYIAQHNRSAPSDWPGFIALQQK